MAKFLFSTLPAAGHVAPFLSTAKKLMEDGHEIVWHSGPQVEEKVCAEVPGVKFVPYQATPNIMDNVGYAQYIDLKGLKMANTMMIYLFVKPMLGQLKDYQDILKDFPADALVVDVCSFGAYTLNKKGGPVWASVGINPYRSEDSPNYGSGKLPAKNALGKTGNHVKNWFADHVFFRKVTARLNEELLMAGLQPIQRGATAFDKMTSPFLHLHGTTEAFEFPCENIPPQVHFVGPMLPPAPTNFTPPQWWEDLKGKQRVVHVTQGTVHVNMKQLILPTIEAMAGENVLLVVTTPYPELLGSVPDNVRVEKFIPHTELLPYVDAMVTNAGYNGTKIALAHGVPLVVAGIDADKAAVCSRVEYCGAGINLKTKTPTVEELKQAIRTVLSEPSYREKAKIVQSDFASHDSPKEAAALLERLADTKEAVHRGALTQDKVSVEAA